MFSLDKKRYQVYIWSNNFPKHLVSNTDNLCSAMRRAELKYRYHKERVNISVHDSKIGKDLRYYYPIERTA
jgi:hypothetical protein